MIIHYDDLMRVFMTHPATRWEPADYDESEAEYDYDADDGLVSDALADKVDSDSPDGFDDKDELNAYVEDNFDELCERYMDYLRAYFREAAEKEMNENPPEAPEPLEQGDL